MTAILIDPKNKLVREHWDLASCQVSLNSIQQYQRRSRKISQPFRGQGSQLVILISQKNTILVEDVEISLPVKFPWILFSSFRGEVENISANQRPGWPFCISDQPEKHKLGRGHWDLASCQVSLNSVQRRSGKCLGRSSGELNYAILCKFSSKILCNE